MAVQLASPKTTRRHPNVDATRIMESPSIMGPERAALVVIDPRPLIRDCLVSCLNGSSGGYAVLAFGSVSEWQQAAKEHPPAAVVMLCIQGRKRGIELIESNLSLISQGAMSVPVVIVSDVEDSDHVLSALDGGARGYIPTSIPFDIAVEAIRLVEAGGTFVPASTLVNRKRTEERIAARNGIFTARQAAVLEAVIQGKANKQIAYALNMREGTVKVHLRHIMKKLNAKNRTEVAVLATNLFRGEPEG